MSGTTGYTQIRAVLSPLLTTIALVALSTGVVHAEGIEGIYEGMMHLTDGGERDIPLSVSLVRTNETIDTPRGTEYIIDGACVIDEEGGPYTFVKVTYDIDENIIDLRYSRPRNDPSVTAPSSFRLSGKFNGEALIEGRVLSGTYGVIGTFKISRAANKQTLSTKMKYTGEWTGIGYNHFTKENTPFTIFITKGVLAAANPQTMEFDFTPARNGGLKINFSLVTFNFVAIDYLRRKVLLQDIDKYITISADLDFTKQTMTGYQFSGMNGLNTTFKDLKLVSTPMIPGHPVLKL